MMLTRAPPIVARNSHNLTVPTDSLSLISSKTAGKPLILLRLNPANSGIRSGI
jgi:hypothetical protein